MKQQSDKGVCPCVLGARQPRGLEASNMRSLASNLFKLNWVVRSIANLPWIVIVIVIYIYLILYPYRVPGAKQELTTNSLHSIEPTVWFSVRGCQFSMMVEISLAKQIGAKALWVCHPRRPWDLSISRITSCTSLGSQWAVVWVVFCGFFWEFSLAPRCFLPVPGGT